MKSIELYGGDFSSRGEIHEYLADTLEFPSYYGRNLDALHDCLTDLAEDAELTVYDGDAICEYAGETWYEGFCRALTDAAEENTHFSWSEG